MNVCTIPIDRVLLDNKEHKGIECIKEAQADEYHSKEGDEQKCEKSAAGAREKGVLAYALSILPLILQLLDQSPVLKPDFARRAGAAIDLRGKRRQKKEASMARKKTSGKEWFL